MLKRIILLSTLAFASFISFGQANSRKISLTIDSIKKTGENITCYKYGDLYNLYFTIKNEGKDSTGFWLMKCSKSDFFLLKSEDFSFCYEICNGNFPVFFEVPPNGKVSATLDLVKKKSSKDGQSQIGMFWFNENEYPIVFSDSDLDKKKNDIIWSNTIKVD
jgi:hypothetical protein